MGPFCIVYVKESDDINYKWFQLGDRKGKKRFNYLLNNMSHVEEGYFFIQEPQWMLPPPDHCY